MEDLSSQQDVITAAALIFFVLLAFIAFLYLNRKGKAASSGGPKTPNAKVVVPQGEQGTVFVKTEDGRAVRRSARQANKPVTPLVRGLNAWRGSTHGLGRRRGCRTLNRGSDCCVVEFCSAARDSPLTGLGAQVPRTPAPDCHVTGL